MWKEIAGTVHRPIHVREQVEKNRSDIADLQDGLENLTKVVQHLVYEIQHLREREANEREKIELRLENQLLRFERRLPPARVNELE